MVENVGVSAVLPRATADMRGENSEMGRIVMLEEALRDSPCGSGKLDRSTPWGFFGTNWGSDRKEKRWEEECTENTGKYGRSRAGKELAEKLENRKWKIGRRKWKSEKKKWGNTGVRGEVASGWWRVARSRAGNVRPFAKSALGKGVERVARVPVAVPGHSEMAQEQRPLSITGKHSTLFTCCLLLFRGY
jgi:hypothetical protein